MAKIISTYQDKAGRDFHYSLIDNSSEKLVIHFTAFFGDWGDRKEFKDYYQGYFHRYKMFSDLKNYSFLFLCDEYGFTKNGTYYTGEKGDFFVESAIQEIIDCVLDQLGISNENVISVGSSMGATGAIKFGLMNNFMGIIAIAPHLDLDLCAKHQGREEHVAWICPDGNTQAPYNYKYTRQIRTLVEQKKSELPRLFIHSCKDDYGVFKEQVIPFMDLYKASGGAVDAYIKYTGGHGSDACGKEVLVDVIKKYFEKQKIEIFDYKKSGFCLDIFKFYFSQFRLLSRYVKIKFHSKKSDGA